MNSQNIKNKSSATFHPLYSAGQKSRLIASLRLACRVLGMRRRRSPSAQDMTAADAPAVTTILSFKTFSAHSLALVAVAVLSSSHAFAQFHEKDTTLNKDNYFGFFVNDFRDSGCGAFAESISKQVAGNANCNTGFNTQTTRTVFYGDVIGGNSGGSLIPGAGVSHNLSLGGMLHVNAGKIELGDNTGTDPTFSMRMGSQATINALAGKNSLAIGSNVVSETDRGTATIASGERSIAIGSSAQASAANSVAIGASSVTSAVTNVGSATIGGVSRTFAGGTANSAFSVGSDTVKRQVQNVAAGRMSTVSTDAVNGSQLFAVATATDQNTANINKLGSGVATYVGGGASYVNNEFKGPSNLGGTGKGNINDAIDTVRQVANNANAGLNVQTNNSAATTIAPKSTLKFTDGQNIKMSRNAAGDIVVETANELKADSFSTENAKLSSNGLTIGSGSLGITTAGVNAGGLQINNVKAGDVNASSLQAVNGSQLNTTNIAVAANTTTIANNATNLGNLGNSLATVVGGGASYVNNVFTGPGDIGGTGKGNINDAIASVRGSAETAGAGFTVSANGKTGKVIKPNDTVDFIDGENVDVLASGDGKITVGTKKNVTFDRAAVGGHTINTDGLSLSSGPKMLVSGIDAGGLEIKNVKGGRISADSLDAVNGSQLFETQTRVSSLGSSLAKNLGGSSAYDAATGNVTTADVGNTGKNTVHDAIDDIRQKSEQAGIDANKGFQLDVNGDKSTIKPGDTVGFKNGDNIGISRDDNGNIVVSTAKDLKVDSLTADKVQTGRTTMTDEGVKIDGGPSMTVDGMNAGGKKITNVAAGTADSDAATVGQLRKETTEISEKSVKYSDSAKTTIELEGNGGTTIDNLRNGEISKNSKQAVNGSQLNATNENVDRLKNDAKKMVRYDEGANSVTFKGIDPSAPVLLSNVDAGRADTDAVNVKQLKETASTTLIESKSYTDMKSQQTLASANSYTDEKFQSLNQGYERLAGDVASVRKEARTAAAVGLSAAALRYDERPGKLSAAIGAGTWRGEKAMSMGLGYTNMDQNVRANVSATIADGNWGVNAGLSFTLN